MGEKEAQVHPLTLSGSWITRPVIATGSHELVAWSAILEFLVGKAWMPPLAILRVGGRCPRLGGPSLTVTQH